MASIREVGIALGATRIWTFHGTGDITDELTGKVLTKQGAPTQITGPIPGKNAASMDAMTEFYEMAADDNDLDMLAGTRVAVVQRLEDNPDATWQVVCGKGVGSWSMGWATDDKWELGANMVAQLCTETGTTGIGASWLTMGTSHSGGTGAGTRKIHKNGVLDTTEVNNTQLLVGTASKFTVGRAAAGDKRIGGAIAILLDFDGIILTTAEHLELHNAVGNDDAGVAAEPTLGIFAPQLRAEGWFDNALVAEGWFDRDLIGPGSDGAAATVGSSVAQVVSGSTVVAQKQGRGAAVAGAVLAATSVARKQGAAQVVGALATGSTAAGRKQGVARALGQVVSGSIAVGHKGARAVAQLVSGSLATARKQAKGTVASLIVAGSSSTAFVPGVASIIKGAVIALATSVARKQAAASPAGGLASGATSAAVKRASGSATAGLASGSTSAGQKRGTGSITGLIASTSLVAGIGGRTGSGRGLVITGTTVVAANAAVLDRRGTVGASSAVVGGVGAAAVPREGVGAGVAVLGSSGGAAGVVGGVGGVVTVRDTVGAGTE